MAEKIIYDIEVDSKDAQAELDALSNSMNAATGNSDALSSSISRMTDVQGTVKKSTEGVVTSVGNTTREFNTNKISIDQVNVSLKSLNSTYDGVKPTNLDEFLNGTTEASRELIAAKRDLDNEIRKIAQSNLSLAATEKELADEIKRVTTLNQSEYDQLNKNFKAKSKATKATKSNTQAVIDNGGAIAIADQLTGGYASMIKNAWEARTVLNGATKAGTVATEVDSAATAKNTGLSFRQNVVLGAKTLWLKAVTAAQWLWNAALNANPIGIVVAAVAGLIAIGYAAIKMFKYFTDNTEQQVAASEKLTASIKAQEAAQNKANKESAIAANQAIALAEANGESREEIEKLELKLADQAIATAKVNDATNKATLALAENTLETLKNSGAKDEAIEAAETAVAEAKKLLEKGESDLVKANDNKINIVNSHIIAEARAKKAASDKAYKEKERRLQNEADLVKRYQKEHLDGIKSNEEKIQSVLDGYAIDREAKTETQALNNAKKEYDTNSGILQDNFATNEQLADLWNTYQQKRADISKDWGDKGIEADRQSRLTLLEAEMLGGANSYDEKRAQIKKQTGILLEDKTLTEAEKTLIEKQGQESRKKIDKLEIDDKIAMVAAIGSMFTALSNISAESTANDKALATAGAVISAGAGIASIWGNTSDVGPTPVQIATKIAGSIAIAANTAKTIKQISAVKVPGAKGGGKSGGANIVTPNFNVVGQSRGTVDTDQALADNVEKRSAPIRAYVVSTDITSQQELDRGVERSNTIG